MRAIIAAFLVLMASTPEDRPSSSSSAIYKKMMSQESALLGLAPQQRSDLLQRTYVAAVEESIFRQKCTGVAVDQLDDVFSATALMAFYRRDAMWTERVQCLHAAMVAHDMAEARHHRKLHGLLIAIRRFDQANELRRRFEIEVPQLPPLAVASGSGISVISMVGGDRLEQSVLLPRSEEGIQVIAMVHPFCGFSTRALDSILGELRYAWLRPYLQLVVPREPAWPESAIRAWNIKNPAHPMHAQAMGQAWQSLGTHETPVFHLLRNGELIVSVTGWKGDGAELDIVRKFLEDLER
ncbi:hypothetical protein [Stenotrophomonas rhizophila]|uniref:hypothetical protein n=1 Tax=Stenotrophomonas rhizophila TaxID=216778 RepID=UPI001E32F1FA|nr:hypothetical protein [Stenotrophomonas rhizophila]MCC7633101.1 hypothetical protein [Stenotrophomonas rhizophila]MCC7661994.1 hypothetical protein [Stenotrophomonas rhizophila]